MILALPLGFGLQVTLIRVDPSGGSRKGPAIIFCFSQVAIASITFGPHSVDSTDGLFSLCVGQYFNLFSI
jgi:hypothetical protein